MSAALEEATMGDLAAGGHVCAVVGDDAAHEALAARFLVEGAARGEKAVAFGPAGSPLLARLEPLAAIAADPYVAFLDRGALEFETMFAVFREQTALAAREGYRGLRVAADMDWMLPSEPTPEHVVGFELLLDRLLAELGAVVLCAYRLRSYDEDTITGALCVHPARTGHDDEPPFTLVAGERDAWRLGGAVDMAGAPHLAGALAATAGEPCVVDVTELEFIDVAGMRAIAEAARAAGVPVELKHAGGSLRRHWALAGFDRFAPTVRLTG